MSALLEVPLTAAHLHGAVEVEATDRGLVPRRLPSRALAQVADPQLTMAASQPSGVRLVLRTAATVLELDTIPTKRLYGGLPPRPDGVYEVVVDGEVVTSGSVTGGDTLAIDLATGTHEHRRGEPGTLRLDGLRAGEKTVEVWLPHDETTALVALRADEEVFAVPRSGRVWVHHGSSISQGSNATHPLGTWPALAARSAGVDLVNMGYGGGALLDPVVGRAVRDAAAGLGPDDLISLELGINLVNADLMRRRALGPAVHGYLDTIREALPDVPVLLVSPLLCPEHEDTPGPSMPAMDGDRVVFRAAGDPAAVAAGALTLTVVREVLAQVVAQRADPGVRLLDGRELYGEADHAAYPLPDGLHPGPETHRQVGERFAALALNPR